MGEFEDDSMYLGLEELFGRELFPHDRGAISQFGFPKYNVHTRVKVEGKTFYPLNILWSSHFLCWTYLTPNGVYQAESDLERV